MKLGSKYGLVEITQEQFMELKALNPDRFIAEINRLDEELHNGLKLAIPQFDELYCRLDESYQKILPEVERIINTHWGGAR